MHQYTPLHVLGCALVFSVIDILTRVALDAGAHALTFLLIRSLATIVILAVYLRWVGVSLALARRDRNIAFVLGAIGSINIFSLTYAIGALPVPLVMLIFYTYPVITSVVSWMQGRERPSLRSAAALVLALVGLALALRADASVLNAAGVAAALVSSVSQALVFLLIGRYFHGADLRPRTLYMQVATVAIFIAATLLTGIYSTPRTAMGWIATGAVPFLYSVAWMILLGAAASSMGPVRSSFYMNFGPIGTIVLSAIFLAQVLTPVQLLGGAMVIGALFLFRPPPRRAVE